jgi:hypothetical protein
VTSNLDDAFWFAAVRGWLPVNSEPNEPARLDGIALLLMNSFDLQGGFMYSVFGSPHHAFRELVYREIIQGRADPYVVLSGERLIIYTGRILAELEKKETAAAIFAENRLTRQKESELQPTSLDFGIVFNQYVSGYFLPIEDDPVNNIKNEFDRSFEYRADVIPRVSFLLGDIGMFFMSLGFTMGYNGTYYDIPELLRTDVMLRFGEFGIRGGRFHYSDPMNFVVNSLLDGFQVTHNSPMGRFGLGAWFTGILYKKNAQIMITDREQDIYDAPIDRKDYHNTYFAPQRYLVSLDWEHPSVGGFMQVNTAFSAQMDGVRVPGASRFHSQYLTCKVSIPYDDLSFILGGTLGTFFFLVEGNNFGNIQLASNYPFALAGELGVYWTLPTSFDSTLSFTGNYATGNEGDFFSSYAPLTARFFGDIFQVKMSGFTIFKLNYSARFHHTFGANFSASYYIRNDVSIHPGNLVGDGDAGEGAEHMGAEVMARFVFSPFSDLQFNLGMGSFFPAMGNNWPGAKPIYRIDLTTIFGLY